MNRRDFLWIVDALCTISAQVQHNQVTLSHILRHMNVELPPELVKAGEDLAAKTEALRTALAEAEPTNTPTKKEG